MDLPIDPVVEDNRFSDFLDTEAIFDVTNKVVDAVRKALRGDFTPNIERILNEGLRAMMTPKKKSGSVNGGCVLDSALCKAGEQCRYFGEVPADNPMLGELFDYWFRGFRDKYITKGVLANFPALKNVPIGKWVSLKSIAHANGVRGVNAETLNNEFRLFMGRKKSRPEKRFEIEFLYTSYDCDGKVDG